jgi:hypothetical protein
MPVVEEVHVNDVGTVFEITVKDGTAVVDISSATSIRIFFKKPDGTVSSQTATFSTNGEDGKMKYTSVSGFLDKAGSWRIQGRVIMSGGTWRTSIGNFDVYANL